MPRYKLRTLLILLAIAPPVLAGIWFTIKTYSAIRAAVVAQIGRL
jgi:hypothetical protein